jgi:hypothetical protein
VMRLSVSSSPGWAARGQNERMGDACGLFILVCYVLIQFSVHPHDAFFCGE